MLARQVVHGSQKNISRESDLTDKITLTRSKIRKGTPIYRSAMQGQRFGCRNSDILDQFKWLGYLADTTILYNI